MISVFSDLDGTFLDHTTYQYEESLPGYYRLEELSIPLVFVSSKTFAEIRELSLILGHTHTFVFENGAGCGIYDPQRNDYRADLTGRSYDDLIGMKSLLRKVIGYQLTTFDEMSIDDIADSTGLSQERSAYAKSRLGSLPFLVHGSSEIDLDTINTRLAQEGLICTQGGRFYHLTSIHATKGVAVCNLLKKYRTGTTLSMAVGDSPNDIPMLDAVDCPYIVKRYDGTYLQHPQYKKTRSAGPDGFTEAVLDFTERLEWKGYSHTS